MHTHTHTQFALKCYWTFKISSLLVIFKNQIFQIFPFFFFSRKGNFAWDSPVSSPSSDMYAMHSIGPQRTHPGCGFIRRRSGKLTWPSKCGKRLFHFIWHLWGHIWCPVSSLGFLSKRKNLANWWEPSAGPPGWLGAAARGAEREAEGTRCVLS